MNLHQEKHLFRSHFIGSNYYGWLNVLLQAKWSGCKIDMGDLFSKIREQHKEGNKNHGKDSLTTKQGCCLPSNLAF